ncbi:hypothetical protein COOONC_25130 [Cooperia oncophora]
MVAMLRRIFFDFYKDDYDGLRQYISQIDIGFVCEILENTFSTTRWCRKGRIWSAMGDNPPADRQILQVNALGAAEFISMVLPPMEKRGGGQIVVLSSCLGIRPIPYVASYSAGKVRICRERYFGWIVLLREKELGLAI